MLTTLAYSVLFSMKQYLMISITFIITTVEHTVPVAYVPSIQVRASGYLLYVASCA